VRSGRTNGEDLQTRVAIRGSIGARGAPSRVRGDDGQHQFGRQVGQPTVASAHSPAEDGEQRLRHQFREQRRRRRRLSAHDHLVASCLQNRIESFVELLGAPRRCQPRLFHQQQPSAGRLTVEKGKGSRQPGTQPVRPQLLASPTLPTAPASRPSARPTSFFRPATAVTVVLARRASRACCLPQLGCTGEVSTAPGSACLLNESEPSVCLLRVLACAASRPFLSVPTWGRLVHIAQDLSNTVVDHRGRHPLSLGRDARVAGGAGVGARGQEGCGAGQRQRGPREGSLALDRQGGPRGLEDARATHRRGQGAGDEAQRAGRRPDRTLGARGEAAGGAGTAFSPRPWPTAEAAPCAAARDAGRALRGYSPTSDPR
jgi:hypothetical protein